MQAEKVSIRSQSSKVNQIRGVTDDAYQVTAFPFAINDMLVWPTGLRAIGSSFGKSSGRELWCVKSEPTGLWWHSSSQYSGPNSGDSKSQCLPQRGWCTGQCWRIESRRSADQRIVAQWWRTQRQRCDAKRWLAWWPGYGNRRSRQCDAAQLSTGTSSHKQQFSASSGATCRAKPAPSRPTKVHFRGTARLAERNIQNHSLFHQVSSLAIQSCPDQ